MTSCAWCGSSNASIAWDAVIPAGRTPNNRLLRCAAALKMEFVPAKSPAG